MRRSRERPDDSSATSSREDRASDERPASRPVRSGAAQSHVARPDGRAGTRASDDALVAFQRGVGAPGNPADLFDPDESFDAHDTARGIRARTVRNGASRADAAGLSRAAGSPAPAAGTPRAQPRREAPAAGPSDAFERTARAPARQSRFENADGDQYSRTSEQATRRTRRRTRGPFDERSGRDDRNERDEAASSARSGAAREASSPDGDTPRTRPERPARSLKGRALGYLSRREYSRSELARKLAPYVEEGDDPEALLDALERENWLSDARFTESLVHRRASRLGTARILGELKRHAVDGELVESVTEQLRETEFSRAQAVWRKKFGSLPGSQAERARQARFLASRGFSSSTIVKILKGAKDDFEGA
ncbi:MAG: recombination regulator RecX [Burkholderia sp.]